MQVQYGYHWHPALGAHHGIHSGPTAGMALVGHADANSHALLNTRKLPVYSTCRLCQQTQTLNLIVVVQGQCTMGLQQWD
jgi:hypothetical protein